VAVNFIDIYFRTGRYPLALPKGERSSLGSDAVGVVEAVGEGARDIKPGDRVGYLLGPQGAYSDVRLMPAAILIPLPAGVSDRSAATLMMKGRICGEPQQEFPQEQAADSVRADQP